ncbi:MAG: hypothetical protein KDK70_35145 [Myxococcales bacterium]|nr:hypothetical protein [Myxococcales bacterium]
MRGLVCVLLVWLGLGLGCSATPKDAEATAQPVATAPEVATAPAEAPPPDAFDACAERAYCKGPPDPVITARCSIEAAGQRFEAESSGSCRTANAMGELQSALCAAGARVTQAEWAAAQAACQTTIDPCRAKDQAPCEATGAPVTCTFTKDGVHYSETGPSCAERSNARTAILLRLCDEGKTLGDEELSGMVCRPPR